MENQKNNKGVIALLIVIIVILSSLCILFATGTISFNSTEVNDNSINENNTDNNQTNENKNSAEDDNVANENNNAVSNINYTINFDELSKFGKSDYNFIKNEYTNEYSFNLSVDGKINISFENYISNISNAKDIHLFRTTVSDTLYILTENGDIYKYDLTNYDSKNYNATKINEYSNIQKMITYRTRKANAGGCDYFVIIDNNGKYYNLDSSCV